MRRAEALALLITVALGVAIVAATPGITSRGDGRITTETYAEALGGAAELSATLSMRAGTVAVRTTGGANAYEATIRRSSRVTVSVVYRPGSLMIVDETRRLSARRTVNDWTVALNHTVPLRLAVSTGAGRATLDLSGMTGSAEISAGAGEVRVEFGPGSGVMDRLVFRGGAGRLEAFGLGNAHAQRIEAQAGVGEFTLDFSGSARGATEVEIKGGVGRVTLIVPPTLGARIRVPQTLVSRANLVGFRRIGEEEYVNDAWATAAAKIDVRASLGVGEFEVRGR